MHKINLDIASLVFFSSFVWAVAHGAFASRVRRKVGQERRNGRYKNWRVGWEWRGGHHGVGPRVCRVDKGRSEERDSLGDGAALLDMRRDS